MSNPIIVHTPFHHDQPVWIHPLGSHSEILDRNKQFLDAAIAMFGRVYFFRMDIRFPENHCYPNDNSLISLFMEAFVQDRISAGHGILYLWVWEQDTSHNHHYHCAFCFNGYRTQNIYGHVAAAKRIWGRLLDIDPAVAPIWDCTKDRYGNQQENGIRIDRNDPEFQSVYTRCLGRLAYLAKVSTKETIPAGVRKFGSSQLASSYKST